MEWVETTAKTVEEAKNQALDQLGVAEDDAEIVVLDEPRPGLFGRVRGEARVRARVRPTTPRPKLDRRDRKKKDHRDGGGRTGAAADGDTDQDDRSDDRADGGTDSSTGAPRARSTRGGRGGGGRGGRGGRGAAAAPAEVSAEDVGARDAQDADAQDADAQDAGSNEALDDGGGPSGRAGTGAGGARRRSRGRRGGGREGASDGGAPRPDGESGDDGRHGETGNDAVAASISNRPVRTGDKEDEMDAAQVGEEARAFVQGVVDAFGLTGTAAVRQDGDDLEVTVDGADLGLLVGPRGSTLQALQEVTRVAAQRRLGDHDTRLRVDVGGYRVRRREALSKFAHQVAAQVVTDGVAKRLEPMSSADRKVIHDALSGFDGVVTRSEGDDPQRCVVIAPASAPAEAAAGD